MYVVRALDVGVLGREVRGGAEDVEEDATEGVRAVVVLLASRATDFRPDCIGRFPD